MANMTWDNYEEAQKLIDGKATALMHHEDKGFAKFGFPISNYTKFLIGERVFYSVSTSIFKAFLERDLLKARDLSPQNFGNGDAKSVLEALGKTMQIPEQILSAENLYSKENCCWVLERNQNQENQRVLRIDIFRLVEESKDKPGKYDFTGGLLHVFKHFTYNGFPLSTGNEPNEYAPQSIIGLIVDAFFIKGIKLINSNESGDTFESCISISSKADLKFIFYREKNTDVYFIKTVHKEKRK